MEPVALVGEGWSSLVEEVAVFHTFFAHRDSMKPIMPPQPGRGQDRALA